MCVFLTIHTINSDNFAIDHQPLVASNVDRLLHCDIGTKIFKYCLDKFQNSMPRLVRKVLNLIVDRVANR